MQSTIAGMTGWHANGLTYIMPIRSVARAPRADLAVYLRWLVEPADTIVVDGSPAAIFATHAAAWKDALHAGLRDDSNCLQSQAGTSALCSRRAGRRGQIGSLRNGLGWAVRRRSIRAGIRRP